MDCNFLAVVEKGPESTRPVKSVFTKIPLLRSPSGPINVSIAFLAFVSILSIFVLTDAFLFIVSLPQTYTV